MNSTDTSIEHQHEEEEKQQQQQERNDNDDKLTYQSGFGNAFESSALPNGLPKGRNNPKKVPYDCFTEQISGTAFTVPRAENLHTWLYRIHPSTCNGQNYVPVVNHDSNSNTSNGNSNSDDTIKSQKQQHQQRPPYPKYLGHVDLEDSDALQVTPNPLRWKPMMMPYCYDREETKNSSGNIDFIAGLRLVATTSHKPLDKNGLSIYMYGCNQSMTNTHFVNSDGDFLIVPQQGSLLILTELGKLIVHPQQICVVPRGFVFSVQLLSNNNTTSNGDSSSLLFARGYVLEIYRGHFKLPDLGPIGSNGLANGRDFKVPTAWFVRDETEYSQTCTMVNKFASRLFEKTCPHTPYNVIAWHGNYTPYKYDLRQFCAINSVTYDHLDPSIYTVLTCLGDEGAGTALADFVIFPPRYMATDSNTFRPPWYHRNTMTEFMGLICGRYDAKSGGGFQPGGASLHSCMTPHGPDTEAYKKAINDPCDRPVYFDGGMAFMFETSKLLYVSKDALLSPTMKDDNNNNECPCIHRDLDYENCWQGLEDVSSSFFSKLKSKTTS